MQSNSTDRVILSKLYSATSRHVSIDELMRDAKVSSEILLQRLEVLNALGYAIENHPQYGLKLQTSPDDLMADDLFARLRAFGNSTPTKPIGNQLLIFERTSSTSDVIQRFALEDQEEGLVVFAESQTRGRGRHGRIWHSPPKKGLWFSTLLRPKIEISATPRLTVLTAVAVAQALAKATSLKMQVKWPNDILCNGKKICGILVELHSNSKGIQYANVGIGINVNLKAEEFPSEIFKMATSLQIEAGKPFSRPAIAAEVIQFLNEYYSLIQNDDFSYVLDHWLMLDCTLGNQVAVKWMDGRKARGVASNLDQDGALVLRTDDGVMERITAGEVTLEKL